MIRHAIDGNHFLLVFGNNAGDVFLKLLFPCPLNQVLSAFRSEYDLDIDLRKGVCHRDIIEHFL